MKVTNFLGCLMPHDSRSRSNTAPLLHRVHMHPLVLLSFTCPPAACHTSIVFFCRQYLVSKESPWCRLVRRSGRDKAGVVSCKPAPREAGFGRAVFGVVLPPCLSPSGGELMCRGSMILASLARWRGHRCRVGRGCVLRRGEARKGCLEPFRASAEPPCCLRVEGHTSFRTSSLSYFIGVKHGAATNATSDLAVQAQRTLKRELVTCS